ncbi:hypothetical protein L6250_04190 [Candidatus Parcubacteria bacterium]|nr:hypothetical protein [Patescibacteria group bacterium]MBU4466786.1 hypothetical protein [Patescibacteria group bacterium]MCG2688799.1 hypothetical protein [Candidatus Parcubacteria bacterium]
MYKTASSLIEKCQRLRERGFTLGEIVKTTELPKTTIYGYIRNIPLSLKTKQKVTLATTKRINEFNIKYRKGKCIPGRVVLKPKNWNDDLIFLVAHFMFDGEINTHSCIYNNRNESLINRVKFSMEKVFNLRPITWLNKHTGVHRISYHYVELADYIKRRSQELKTYIKTASLKEKGIFLKAFFDDEGSVHFEKRLVRGYQHNLDILRLVRKLLLDFSIENKIDEKYNEIVIGRKENIVKFRDEINFSKRIYINPERKNSIWKKKLEKREILERVINSYQK